MTKKSVITVGLSVIILFIICTTLMVADVSKLIDGKKPIFSIIKAEYEDGGTIEYIGLFYKIFDYKVLDGKNKIEFGTWFKSYDVE